VERAIWQGDVAVVGAGIIGALTAWRLQAAGGRVLLLDRGGAGGATAASAAVLRTLCDEPVLAADGLDWYRRWSGSVPAAPVPLRPSGVLVVTPRAAQQAAQAANGLLAGRAHGGERWGRRALPAGYDPGDGVAWLEPRSGYADPVAMVTSLADAFAARGGTRRQAQASRLDRARGRWRLVTTAGPAEARVVVVAAGSASPPLVPDPGARRPVGRRPVSVGTFDLAGGRPELPAIVDLEHGLLLRPAPGGMLGTLRTAAAGRPFLDALAAAAARLPALRGIAPRLSAVSEFDTTGDGQPLIGLVDDAVILACGFNGGGFKLAPPLTEHVAGLAATGRVPGALRRFDPRRRAAAPAGPLAALA
jgi:glycine/D-amino acid oxidase-like deaminating enzyme